jgi:hypothetical protein
MTRINERNFEDKEQATCDIGLLNIADSIAEYIVDNQHEHDDYIEFCLAKNFLPHEYDNENNLKHIYAQAITYLKRSGYDV